MEEMVMEKHGVSERLLKELIKSPKFKSDLKLILGGIDPAAAGGLIRTLLWEDVETFMGTVSALPATINYLVQAGRELMVQLNTFPPPILIAFLSQLVDEVDFAAMEETVGEFKVLLEKLQPVLDGLKEASSGVRDQVGALRASQAAE
jgi:hypothetical protein